MGRILLFCASAAIIATGCKGNNIQEDIDQWNASFNAQKTACESGNPTACQTACQMALSPTICEVARAKANMDDPAQRAWVDQCPANAARQGGQCCAMAGNAQATPTTPAAVPTPPSPTEAVENAQQQLNNLNIDFERAKDLETQMRAALEQAKAAAEQAQRQAEQAAGTPQPTPNADQLSSETVVKGSLPKETIRRVVSSRNAQLRQCYESRLAVNPNLAGRVAVKFIISGTGAVQMAAVSESTVNDPEVENCTAQVFRRMLFPAPDGGGIVIVTYPIQFQPAQ